MVLKNENKQILLLMSVYKKNHSFSLKKIVDSHLQNLWNYVFWGG